MSSGPAFVSDSLSSREAVPFIGVMEGAGPVPVHLPCGVSGKSLWQMVWVDWNR